MFRPYNRYSSGILSCSCIFNQPSIFPPSSSTDRYLGDQRFSFNQELTFDLRIGEEGARASRLDVVLEGDGRRVSVPIYAQGNPVPRTVDQAFTFRLSEHSEYQWSPQLDAFNFIRLLSNLTAIKIKGAYTDGGKMLNGWNILEWPSLYKGSSHSGAIFYRP